MKKEIMTTTKMPYFIVFLIIGVCFTFLSCNSTSKNRPESWPKASIQNNDYETELVELFNSMGWSEVFFDAIIYSKDFGYKRSRSGVVIGRTLMVYMVSKKSDGSCMYQDFTVIQEKVGDDWVGFKRLSTGSQIDISCT